MKEMAVEWKEHSMMVCVDDKAVVPIGEPTTPISTGVRPHKTLVPLNTVLAATDHDFHVAGAIPSVLFHVNIPSDPRDSFHRGKIHVTVKDKVFQPSSPMRHAAENSKILREISTDDGLDLDSPILFLYSDGRPDHRTNFKSVQLAGIAMFISLNLDMYIAVRTAPMQSYANPAERCMSCLNFALQNVSLCRELTDIELRLKSLTSLTKLRNAAERDPKIKDAYLESVSPVITILNERFRKLVWQEEVVEVHQPADEESIQSMKEMLKLLDENIQADALPNDLSKFPQLKDFMDHHCRCRHYSFQIKKCTRQECAYCTLNPPRLSDEIFEKLHYLPDPVLGKDGDTYLPFNEVYGKDTNDDSRPSLQSKPQQTKKEKASL